MAKPENFLVSCDIGSSKVCVLIGEPNARGGLDILGKGSTAHRGARKGNIINVDSTVEAIKRSAEEAEIMAGAQITRAFAGLSGSAVRSFNSRGVVAVSGKAREISRDDIARVVDAAKSVQVPGPRDRARHPARDSRSTGRKGSPIPR
jgi:cell division protein FtsA